MRERVVLIGAGSTVFSRGLLADLIDKRWDADVALVDTNEDNLAVVEGIARKMVASRGAPLKLSSTTDRTAALRDATVVICTIGVGGRPAWSKDVRIMRRHGIFTAVGDTIGPGGASRALRTIPPMVAIAEDVVARAPDALFFNYSNPMAAVVRAVRKATDAKVVGLCHGVDQVATDLADSLDVPRGALTYTAVGINHLTWFLDVKVDGEDATPRLQSIAEERAGEPFNIDHTPFCWRLFQIFGAFPAVRDRHVSEFFPQYFPDGYYFGKRLGLEVFSLDEHMARMDAAFDSMRRDARSEEDLDSSYFGRIGGEHEKVLDIVESIRNSDGVVYSANLPNTGQVENLPLDVVVESPAIADGGTLRALPQRPLSSALLGTLIKPYMWVESVVDAALSGSRQNLLQALALDGTLRSLDSVESLADELLAAQAQYLPSFWVR